MASPVLNPRLPSGDSLQLHHFLGGSSKESVYEKFVDFAALVRNINSMLLVPTYPDEVRSEAGYVLATYLPEIIGLLRDCEELFTKSDETGRGWYETVMEQLEKRMEGVTLAKSDTPDGF